MNGRGKTALSGLRIRQPLRRFGQPDQVDEFGAITELIRALRALRHRDDVIIGQAAGIFPALQQLAEPGHGDRKADIVGCSECIGYQTSCIRRAPGRGQRLFIRNRDGRRDEFGCIAEFINLVRLAKSAQGLPDTQP